MAVVGPRPLLKEYLPLYNAHQARRHEVRPGFTGYAQVHGRNSITWEDKFDKDVYYVDHISFLGDWKIIFQTIKTVVKREGISSKESVTMCNEYRRYINPDTEFYPAFGDNKRRLEWEEKIVQAGGKLATIIHPTAYIAKSAVIKSGTVVFPKAIINTGCIIGNELYFLCNAFVRKNFERLY